MLKAIVLFLALFATPAFSAVLYEPETKSLEISGQTDTLQLMLVKGVMAKSEVRTIFMWGNGGSYFAGMEIGRMVEESGARVVVAQDCISACAFAAIAAVDVLIDEGARLLFHKPYVTQVPTIGLSIDDLAGKYAEVYLVGVKYMLEMGYSFDFAALIFSSKTTPCILASVSKVEVLNALRGNKIPALILVDLCAERTESYG